MTNALVLSYSVATQKPEVVVEDQRNLLQGNPAHEKVTTRKQAAPAMVINESKERNQFQSSAVNFGYTLYQGQTPIHGEILRKNCACRNEWGVEVGVWAGPQCPLARL